MRACLLLCALIIALSGCGGGGGGTGISPISASNHLLQPGDEITYVSYGGDDAGFQYIHIDVEDSPAAVIYGARRLEFKYSYYSDSVFGDADDPELAQFTSSQLFEQDNNGSLYTVGIGTIVKSADPPVAMLQSATSAPVYIPSTLHVGDSYSYTMTFDGGVTRQVNGKIVSYGYVDGYKTYKAHENITIDDNSWNMDRWIAPDLGYDVKWKSYGTTDGNSFSSEYRLLSKNF